jgi:putative ABC transport system permease protein
LEVRLTGIADDFRHSLRVLHRAPGFAIAAIATLALTIGASTAIFSVVNAVLLRRLPFKDPENLVLLWGTENSQFADRSQVSATDAQDWAQKSHSFEALAWYSGRSFTLTGEGDPQRLSTLEVSKDYFAVMKSRPFLGRFFSADDFRDGAQYVTVLAYDFWKQQFRGDPAIIGKTIPMNFRSYTVLGVAPPDLHSLPTALTFRNATLIYAPLAGDFEDPIEKNRTARHLRVIARLKPEATVESAQADLNVVQAQMIRDHPAEDSGNGVRVVRIKDDLVRNLRKALVLLQCAVIFVVLIACANIANLLLARSTARQREIAIRSALGASRARLVQQVITESLLLAALGGAAGLLLAQWGIAVLVRLGTEVLPELNSVEVSAPVLLFTALMSVITGIIFGMAPALHLASPELANAVRTGSRSAGPSRKATRTRAALVTAQVGLSVVLLVCAGLLLKSFILLERVNPGFDAHNVLTANVSLPEVGYPESNIAKQQAFFRELLAKTASSPGVEAAAIVGTLPESGDFDTVTMEIRGRVFPAGKFPGPDRYIVSSDYFRVFRIPLIKGRILSDSDDGTHPRVIVINQHLAEEYFAEQDPIGQQVKIPTPGHFAPDQEPYWKIVGVVGNTQQYGLASQLTNQIYVPYSQYDVEGAAVLMRAQNHPLALAGTLRNNVRSIDNSVTVSGVETMDQILADSVAEQRFSTTLLMVFGIGALALAALGIYSVISYIVEQRSSEFGIRMALGAQPDDVVRLVIAQGMKAVTVGAVAGCAVALVSTRLLQRFLFHTGRTDLMTFSAVLIVLIGSALVASYAPARRATRVDPLQALRAE